MPEPLIDRDSVTRAVQSGVPIGSVGHVQPITDAVLAYLRSVLTPEAFDPYYDGNDLCRLIFERCDCDETFANGMTRHTCPPARGLHPLGED